MTSYLLDATQYTEFLNAVLFAAGVVLGGITGLAMLWGAKSYEF